MGQDKILWVDDEIELLRSHILFLKEKGFAIDTATNGEDAVELAKNKKYDLIFLDEMMAGMGGLETLGLIKEIDVNIPVVMITKSEEEYLMNEAIGSKISDYLTKPVNPSQVFLVCKKILEGNKISDEHAAKDYLQDFNSISQLLMSELNHNEWMDIYTRLVNWELELDVHPEVDLRQTLFEQEKEANKQFSKFVEKNYKNWVDNPDDENTPTLSNTIIDKYVKKHLADGESAVFFFVLDCLRLDQWQVLEKHLINNFNISTDYYYSILPTATPYSRNSLFSGLFPSEIEKKYPDLWVGVKSDENSMNKYEKKHLQNYLDRNSINLRNELQYIKIIDPEVGRNFERNIHSYNNKHFTAIVVNFLDMLVHGRSDSDLLKEIAPDEAAYRSLTNTWFQHSSLLSTFKSISSIPNAKVIITTDHGSIRSQRGAKVLGDREAAVNLRYKYGRNLKVDNKYSVFIKDPNDFKLPREGFTINYIIAKEDYYFVYPTEYHKYLTYYKDTFQHGGISMEEMLLPIITMEPK